MQSRDCVLGRWTSFGECSTCVDRDKDGFGNDCAIGADCDDTHKDINPAAREIDFDGADNDCEPSTGRDLNLVGYVGSLPYSHVAVYGDRVFAAQGTRLFEYSASDLSAPAVEQRALQGAITHLQRVDSLLYVGVYGVGVVRFDLSAGLRFIDQFTHTPAILLRPGNTAFHVVGNNMLLCDAASDTYSVTRAIVGPTGITQLGYSVGLSMGAFETGSVCDVALVGGRALIGTMGSRTYYNVSFNSEPGLQRTSFVDLDADGLTGLPQASLANGFLFTVDSGTTRTVNRENADGTSATVFINGNINGALLAHDGYAYFAQGEGEPTCVLHSPLSAGPITPSESDCLYMSSGITDIAADGDVIVVAHRQGLAAVRRQGTSLAVTTATPPVIDLPAAYAVEIDRDTLLWLSKTGTVVFFRLPANGGDPIEFARMALADEVLAHGIHNGVLYVLLRTGGSAEWAAIDLHGAAVPTEIVRRNASVGSYPSGGGIGVAGTTLHISLSGRWYAWDIATLSAPLPLGRLSNLWGYDFGEQGGDLIVASSDTIQRFDISNPGIPSLLNTINAGAFGRFAIQGDLLVTGDGDVVDLSTDRVLLSPNNIGRNVTMDGTVAWGTDQNGLLYVRLADLSAITATNLRIPRFGKLGGVSRQDYLYTIHEGALGVFSGVNAQR